jgi:membrane protein YqaA with SNARE-associated domain
MSDPSGDEESSVVPAFMRSRSASGIAALWGFAEATVFFIVPDLWIGLMAAFDPRAGMRGVIAAVIGAIAGGAVVHRAAGRVAPERSAAMLDRIPAISGQMIARVEGEMAAVGPSSMMTGPLKGTPYKLYARAAGVQGRPMLPFLLWTIPARTVRFLLIAAVSAAFGAAVRRRTDRPGWIVGPYAAAWLLFYGWYFRRFRRQEIPPPVLDSEEE